MEFHLHRRIVGCTRLASFSIPAFPRRFLPLTAPASYLIRSQLQLRRLYFNWVDLPHAVFSESRPAQATQFPLLTLCFAPTMFPVGYPAGSEQPHFLLLCFAPTMFPVRYPAGSEQPHFLLLCFSTLMLPVCGFRALNENVAHRSHIDIVVSGNTSFGYLLLCHTRCVNLTGYTLPFLTDPIEFNTSIEQCFSVFIINPVSG